MIIDSRLEFSDKQITTGANVVSTNTVDTQGHQIGPGQPLYVVVQLAADASAATTVDVQSAAAETFAGASTLGTLNIPAGSKAGARFVLGFPYQNARYLRLRYSVAGTFSAWLAGEEPVSWRAMPAVV